MVKEMSFVRMAGLRRCLIWKNTFPIPTIFNGGLFYIVGFGCHKVCLAVPIGRLSDTRILVERSFARRILFTRWERLAGIGEQFQGREEKVGWVRNNLSCVWQLWLRGISRG